MIYFFQTHIRPNGRRLASCCLWIAWMMAICQVAAAQSLSQKAQVADQLKELRQGGKLLYISFLPSQENTRLLIAASKRYHLQTAVFWMSRGEGMPNYNGPEKGIDLGVIHVAEMENAAKLAGFKPFVSSCKDLGARDTASINATLATDRLIIDLATVIRKYRPDILIARHEVADSMHPAANGFNRWMDSVTAMACEVASGRLSAALQKSLPAFTVPCRLADIPVTGKGQSPWQARPVAADTSDAADTLLALTSAAPRQNLTRALNLDTATSLQINTTGADPVNGLSFTRLAIKSQLSYRSVYPDSLLNNPGLMLPVEYPALYGKPGGQRVIRLWRLPDDFQDNSGKSSALSGALSSAQALQSWLDEGAFVNQDQGAPKDALQPGLWPRLNEALRQKGFEKYNASNLQQLRLVIDSLHDLIQSGRADSLITPVIASCLKDLPRMQNSPVAYWPDMLWIEDRLRGIEKYMAGLSLKATTDQPYGILGQNFHLRIRAALNGRLPLNAAALLWVQVPGLTGRLNIPSGPDASFNRHEQSVLDTSLHLPLLQEAYQPFWLNKSLNSDGSYQIDSVMQGRLSDTASYHVLACVLFQGDTLYYEVPVMYRNFDRMAGEEVQPFYTKEPLLVTLTPTVVLTSVLRNRQGTGQKFMHMEVQTLFDDTTQVALFKIRQVGITAVVNGQKINSDTASMIYQEAELLTPQKGARQKLSTFLSPKVIALLNPRTPILKPTVLLKLPEGVQGFASNIKTVGYPYQPARIYNYHSQSIVVKDTIHTTGSHLLYVNGLQGDAFENAFEQLGYEVQSPGFARLAALADETDLTSGYVPTVITDSLRKLDCIVLSGAAEALPTDSVTLNGLKYLLSAYLKEGGRILNLDPDPVLQQVLPVAEKLSHHMLIAGDQIAGQMKKGLDSLPAVLNSPNQVAATFFTRWEGVLSRAGVYKNTVTSAAATSSPFWLSVRSNAVLSPLTISQLPGTVTAGDGGVLPKKAKGTEVNCFLELTVPLSNGRPDAYKLLANLISKPGVTH
ncbi:hypothetical protein SAMN05192529_106128 [Arachidicoccus rhizosphaerae]|uniref:GlcNAc-PI de-N-acetylase n=1 Tax=Arachidicoccus rhizosphaerae TaxID=551991 RepID=A0A1H3XUN3_9BACT|nr:hypothetical protein [Arachidicoccus rhizosphaerae]SEA02940.1 hypothetical protein SAMN05192529_106128 [Arachidicoccus rhizosphaerae]